MSCELSVKMPSDCRFGCLEKFLFSKGFSTLTTKTTHKYKKNRIIVAEPCIRIWQFVKVGCRTSLSFPLQGSFYGGKRK